MTKAGENEIALSRMLIDQIADRWTLRLLWSFCGEGGPVRFNEIKRRVGGIQQKALTQSLRRLERNGIVERRVIAAKPLGVEYSITPLGRSLEEPISALYEWAERNAPQVLRAQASFDQKAVDGKVR